VGTPVLLTLLALAGLGGLCLIAGVRAWERGRGGLSPQPLPAFPTVPPYTPWPTPPVALAFDLPLLPAEGYGPYVRGESGPLAVNTRYGAQNPALGARSNCFRDAEGESVPFSQLYHAGVDLFALDDAGQVAWGAARQAPVYAVADGVVVLVQDAGADGTIVMVEHLLAEGSMVYSVYWHVDYVQVREGQPVARGQVIAVVYDRGLNSHLHWEMRTFRDGTDLFPVGTAGARGTCNGYAAGVGYTWDDAGEYTRTRAHPDAYGYLDPVAFVERY